MSIIDSNNAGIKSVIEEWFEKYVKTKVKPIIVKNENGLFSHIEVDGDVLIHDFPEEKFPDFIVFTKINGNFELSQCHKLNNVAGFPLEVTGDFVCEGCENLEEDAIRYVEKDRVWNMQTVDPNDPKSVKGWLNYFESGRAAERPLRKIGGKIAIK
jgi:hypothetical protein